MFVPYSVLCTWARAHHPSRPLSTLAFHHIEIVISDGFSSLCKRHKPFRWSAALLHTSFQHTPICGHSHEHECEGQASPAWRREVVRLKNLAPLLKGQTMTYRNTPSLRVTWAKPRQPSEGDRLCHVLTRNKSEGINGTPIQHHKIQRLRASLFQHPSLAQGRNLPTQRTRLCLWSREPHGVCRPCSRTPFGRFTTE